MPATRRPWTDDAAAPLVERARERWALTCGTAGAAAEVLWLGTNASYRCGDVVIRVAPAGRAEEVVQRELRIARFLAEAGVPAVRPAPPPAVAVDGHWATAWAWVPHVPRAVVDGRTFGALLRAFHDATDAYDAPLPEWDAIDLIAERLAGLRVNPRFAPDEVATLEGRLDELRGRLRDLGDAVPVGVLHGDAHPGNVIAPSDGSPAVLADFELVGRGPRAWDLAPAALHPRRYGGNPAWWDAVRAGYGRPEDPSWEICVALRELASAVWLFAAEDGVDGDGAPQRSREAEVRLQAFGGAPDPPTWGTPASPPR